jgi:DeoR/GlpR family transcriptional regulator of sugar metabolism
VSPGLEVRRAEVLERVHRDEHVRVTDLTLAFDVCSVTIRADLREIERGGALRRMLRAVAVAGMMGKQSFEQELGARAADKQATGAAEAQMLMVTGGTLRRMQPSRTDRKWGTWRWHASAASTGSTWS